MGRSITRAKIDLHGLTREDAEIALRNFLDNLPNNIRTVDVIHGIGGGVLKEMAAEFYHRRIEHRAPVLSNPGETTYWIL